MEENLVCRVCSATAEPFKQGDSIVVQIRVLNDNGTPVRNLAEHEIEILLSSKRTAICLYGNREDKGVLPVETDQHGYLAFEVGTEQTSKMLGEYYLELSVAREGSKIATATMFVFEIGPSRMEQIKI